MCKNMHPILPTVKPLHYFCLAGKKGREFFFLFKLDPSYWFDEYPSLQVQKNSISCADCLSSSHKRSGAVSLRLRSFNKIVFRNQCIHNSQFTSVCWVKIEARLYLIETSAIKAPSCDSGVWVLAGFAALLLMCGDLFWFSTHSVDVLAVFATVNGNCKNIRSSEFPLLSFNDLRLIDK